MFAVWFEPTDINQIGKLFKTNAWKKLTYISPNINELQVFSQALEMQHQQPSRKSNCHLYVYSTVNQVLVKFFMISTAETINCLSHKANFLGIGLQTEYKFDTNNSFKIKNASPHLFSSNFWIKHNSNFICRSNRV